MSLLEGCPHKSVSFKRGTTVIIILYGEIKLTSGIYLLDVLLPAHVHTHTIRKRTGIFLSLTVAHKYNTFKGSSILIT